jgi:hypothetical protein
MTTQNVNCIETLHHAAMDLADKADRASADEKPALYLRAFQLERDAAELLKGAFNYEPSRSILYRSAASLAAQAGNDRECRRLAKEGLVGNPPPGIAAELRELLPPAPHAFPTDAATG